VYARADRGFADPSGHSADEARSSSSDVTHDAHIFTAAELERMLDWYRALPLCHDVVPRDDQLADKIALEIAKLRVRPSR
jgi:hypothetical protein